MNYNYKIEKSIKAEELICYITSIIILLAAILSNTKSPINSSELACVIFTVDWWKSMIGVILLDIFIIYCGLLIGAERKNFKKWHSNLLENGIKCKGYVKEIKLWGKNSFEVKISYYSEVQKKNITFESPRIKFTTVDTTKQIICDVYECHEYHKIEDYDSELINISGNNINFNINPVKLFKVVHKKYNRKWFGNAIAENFKYE